jgi:hypothetical protein
LPEEISESLALLRGKQIVIDSEMERLLIKVFASHDELVDALKDLHRFYPQPPESVELSLLLNNAEKALCNAYRVRDVD